MNILELLENINALVLTIVNPQKTLALDDIKTRKPKSRKMNGNSDNVNQWKEKMSDILLQLSSSCYKIMQLSPRLLRILFITNPISNRLRTHGTYIIGTYKLEKKGKTFKKPATSSNDLNFNDA